MSPPASPAHAAPARARAALRWRPAALVLLLVLALHALLLGLVPLGVGSGRDDTQRTALQTRRIVQPTPTPPSLDSSPAPSQRPTPQPAATTTPPAAVALHASPAERPALAATSEALAAAPDFEAPEPVPEVGTTAEPVPAAGAGVEVPVFPTRMPAAALLTYELRRGGLIGQGEMAWRPQGEAYQLTLRGQAFGLTLLAWASQGGFDAAGIAPVRFVDRRQSRNPRAANFQRATGTIRFSGPAIEYPLLPGAQDRLSWMVQLPAILQGAAAPPEQGARYPIFVVGARGDADVWTFVVEDRERVEVAEGPVDAALRLLREPRRPFDTRVEVWLDPARQHLPVRLRLTQTGSGETTEFLLRELRWLP